MISILRTQSARTGEGPQTRWTGTASVSHVDRGHHGSRKRSLLQPVMTLRYMEALGIIYNIYAHCLLKVK